MLCEFCDQLYLATDGKINFFTDERIRNMGKYLDRVYIGNRWFVNYADGSPIQTNITHAYIAYLYGQRIQDSRLTALSKELLTNCASEIKMSDRHIRREINTLIYADDIKTQPVFVPNETEYLPALQNSFVRQNGWYYSAKGNHNAESHNHNDIGHFIAYYNNQPVLIDPSNGIYTQKTFSEQRYEIWTMQSGWHNLPVVNGCEEPIGKEFRANAFSLDGKTTTVQFASAYPPEAGLKDLERRISISDEGIDVSDSFRFKGKQNTISEHFITIHDVSVDGDTVVIDKAFALTVDLPCEIVLDSVDFEGDRKLTSEWNTDKMNRIKFEFNCDQSVEVKISLRKI